MTYGDTEFAQRLRFVALRNLERNPEAIDAARAAIRLSPHNANAHYLLATALWTLTPPDSEGLTHVQRAIDLDPDVPLYRSLLARMVFETNPDYAEQLLRVIVRDTPDDAKALNDLGVLLELRGSHVLARERYTASILADPRQVEAQYNLSRIAWVGLPRMIRGSLVIAALVTILAVGFRGLSQAAIAEHWVAAGAWLVATVAALPALRGVFRYLSRGARQPAQVTFRYR